MIEIPSCSLLLFSSIFFPPHLSTPALVLYTATIKNNPPRKTSLATPLPNNFSISFLLSHCPICDSSLVRPQAFQRKSRLFFSAWQCAPEVLCKRFIITDYGPEKFNRLESPAEESQPFSIHKACHACIFQYIIHKSLCCCGSFFRFAGFCM